MKKKKVITTITTIRQEVEIDTETGATNVLSSAIIDTKIIDENDKKVNQLRHQFSPTETRYGILSLGKRHPLSTLHKPSQPINVSIEGIYIEGKWNSQQPRIDGLTTLYKNFSDLESHVFNMEYIPDTNTISLTEI